MTETTPCVIRFPNDLFALLHLKASELGLSVNDAAVSAVEIAYGFAAKTDTGFLRDVAGWVTSKFAPSAFPEDVTLQLFRHIKAHSVLRSRYDELCFGSDGKIDPHCRQRLHQRIGAVVKRTLKATVAGRLGPFDNELIQSCALLRPTAS